MVSTGVVGILVAGLLVACGGDENSAPARAARAFAAALSAQDVNAAAELTTSPSQASESLGMSFAGMHARRVEAQVTETVEYSDGTGSFSMKAVWTWADDREFETVTNGSVRRLSTGWKVQWEPGLLHTGMPVGGRLQMVRTDATPAPKVRNSADRALMQMQAVNDVVIDPTATKNPQRSVNQLAAALKPIAPLVTARVINDKIVANQGGETVAVTLRNPDMKMLAADPERIAGVSVVKGGMLVMTDRRISTPLVGGLTNYWQALRDATAGWAVQQVAPGKAPVRLGGEQGGPAPDIKTTVDVDEQLLLGESVVEVAQPTTMMSFDARSGAIRGMAQNDAAADKTILADVAYPTGSTLDPVFSALDAQTANDGEATERMHKLGLGLTITVPGVVAPGREASRRSVSEAAFRPQDFTATMITMGTLGVSVARSLAGETSSAAPFLIKNSPAKVSGGSLGAMDREVTRRIAAAMTTTARSGDASDITSAPGLRALVGTNGPQGPGWFIGISEGKVIVIYCEDERSGSAALQVAQKYYRLS
ncbi:MAG: NTF2-like N-terminal transpeptidase domain-containing protein [Gordonia sp. (in: high G+C Gram-positive bacteria)]|uniref:NTF2-like N-terminal transpeptidase domain-containing protein n=1 Tax=Gordonia sp. (in: high G+C Gram-positive bacteria) TaxID=84139 RepID=UPI0039E64847